MDRKHALALPATAPSARAEIPGANTGNPLVALASAITAGATASSTPPSP